MASTRRLREAITDAVSGRPPSLARMYAVVRGAGAVDLVTLKAVLQGGIVEGALASGCGLEECRELVWGFTVRLRAAGKLHRNIFHDAHKWMDATIEGAWSAVCQTRRQASSLSELSGMLYGLHLDPMDLSEAAAD